MMWPNSTFGFRIFWILWSLRIFRISLVSRCYRFSCAYPLLMIQILLVLICCYKSPCAYVQQRIPLPSLRTRRCVGIGIFDLRLHQVSLRIQSVDLELLRISLELLFTDEELVRDRNGQVRRRWPGFRHNPAFFVLLLHPFRHPFGAAGRAEILGTTEKAEMADVEQMKKIVPLITCEIAFCQYVCDLVFDVNVHDLNLRVKVDSVKQPIKSNSECSWHTCLIVELLPLIIILITAQMSSNKYNIALVWEKIRIRAWLELWFDSWCACSTWRDATSLPVPMNPWFYEISFGNNGRLQRPNSKDPELGYHPSVEKLSQLQLEYEKLIVSCTSNLLARTCGFRKCRRFRPTLVLNPPGPLRNQNLGIIQSALLCSVSHITILFEFTYVINVRDQTR